VTGEIESVRVVDDGIKDGIGVGGIADHVPFRGEYARHTEVVSVV
jgi:hypothetical protein